MKPFVKVIFFLSSNLISALSFSQPLTSSSIFAHNDYLKPNPFYESYLLEVGYIEVDIFLKNGELLVAHTRMELNSSRTLDSLYLRPLRNTITKNNGLAYASGKKLTLMIDLKTKGDPTLKVLVDKIQHYPELIDCKNFVITVSGDMPDPSTWKNYPEFIHFDGRPGIAYNSEQLARVELISDSFTNYSHWNGKGQIKRDDKERIANAIKKAHEIRKPIRFWAIPDNDGAWAKLIELQVDILNTDNVAEAVTFVKGHRK